MSSPLSNPSYYLSELSRRAPAVECRCDVAIYGATVAGITAAIEVARGGHQVVILHPGGELGGMTASGLGFTDVGNKGGVGGLALEFYRRMGKAYGASAAWTFEPHVAKRVLQDWLAEAGIALHLQQFLSGCEKIGQQITAVRMECGTCVQAKYFIDATYEGDLLAAAGVSHTVGREDNTLYAETLNGAQVRSTHQFEHPVDPYRVPGDTASGLLFGIERGTPEIGQGDHRIQAYCFRMCLTDDPTNLRRFPRPIDYDRNDYALLERYLATGWNEVFMKFDRLRVRSKTDTNNHGAVSTDYIGQNYAWPTASYAEREIIFQAHLRYQQGYHWFLTHDDAVPRAIRDRYANWGLCRDEFTQTGGWPHQLYVREARRLISDYVMTEHDCRGTRVCTDSIGLAAYAMDSHNCRRFVIEGRVFNEGDVQVLGFPPYPISYRSITPLQKECANLVVPVCLAASHIAYGSIRMEPVFMILGQSAGVALRLCLADDLAVQALPYEDLKASLIKAGQVLTWNASGEFDPSALHAYEAAAVPNKRQPRTTDSPAGAPL